MKVVVLGAAGQIGRLTVARAVASGYGVTAFARDVARLKSLSWASSRHVSLTEGDLRDASAVASAIAGHDAVIAAFGAPLNRQTILRVPDICTVATQNALNGMTVTGVKRLICISAIGVGDSRGAGRVVFRRLIQPLLLNRIFEDRERQERLIMQSNRDWVIVRPAELTDEPASNNYRVLLNLAGQRITTVPRADVADFLIRKVESDEYLRKTPLLTV